MRDKDITINRKVRNRWKWYTMLKFFNFFLIAENSIFAIMSANSNVKVITFFIWVPLSFFFAPFTFAEGIENKLKSLFSVYNVKKIKKIYTFPSSNRTLMWRGTSFPLKSAVAVCKLMVNPKIQINSNTNKTIRYYLPDRVFSSFSLDNQSLPWFKRFRQFAAIWNWLNLLNFITKFKKSRV